MIGTPRSSFSSTRRRERLPWPAGQPFRILSIDGGGIRGIFPAAILAQLEARFLGGKSIASHFDLITGTSTGGILALGLAVGRTSHELLQLYMRDGREIFPPGKLGRLWRSVRGLALYRYDRAALTSALETVLGTRTLAESGSRLCIPAFEGHHGEVYILKTPHHPDYRIDGWETMVTAGQATSAAPCYFRALDSGGYRFVDGGVWANNPIMIGLVDALACFAIDPTQIRIVSLGCGREPVRVGPVKAIGGVVTWAKAIFAAMDLQSQNALGQARLLVGPERVHRLEPRQIRPIALDDWRRAHIELPLEAERVVASSVAEIATQFLTTEIQRPQFFWPPTETRTAESLAAAKD
jgi:hypothetical protein